MPEPLLSFTDLRIEATSYPPGEAPRHIVLVEGVSVSVEKGKVLGLIGESGAGKSTIGLSAMAYGRGGVRLTEIARDAIAKAGIMAAETP